VLAAVGRSGVELDIEQVDIWYGDVRVAREGRAEAYSEPAARQAALADPVRIGIRLGAGPATASIWTCDLSHGYVDINAHYRT
jgi:glutamate N-acetyltransferase/amino-acid N-acetyltransferase